MLLRRRPDLLRGKTDRRAGTLVELALIMLVCMVLMFAIFEYGRYVFVRQQMENAARAGARQASVTATSYLSTTTANSMVGNVVTTAMAGSPATNVTWTAYQSDSSGNNIGAWTATPFGNMLVVQVNAQLPLMFPMFPFIPGGSGNSISITTTSMMRSEAN
jgi:Flp pilus assembly protein TadG